MPLIQRENWFIINSLIRRRSDLLFIAVKLSSMKGRGGVRGGPDSILIYRWEIYLNLWMNWFWMGGWMLSVTDGNRLNDWVVACHANCWWQLKPDRWTQGEPKMRVPRPSALPTAPRSFLPRPPGATRPDPGQTLARPGGTPARPRRGPGSSDRFHLREGRRKKGKPTNQRRRRRTCCLEADTWWKWKLWQICGRFTVHLWPIRGRWDPSIKTRIRLRLMARRRALDRPALYRRQFATEQKRNCDDNN